MADRRTVLLDERAERQWVIRANAGGEWLRIAPRDWSFADEWLFRSLRSPATRQGAADWAASVLQADSSTLLSLSAPLHPVFAERLFCAGGDELRNATGLCAELLGWTNAPLMLDRFERWTAYATIVPNENLPAVLLDGRAEFLEALEQGDRLATAGVPVALLATPARWRNFLAKGGWSRSDTRWRFANPFTEADSSNGEAELREKATEDFVRSNTPAALPFLEKARAASGNEKRSSPSGAARSAAEAFLYAVLDARSFTKGRFQLNAALDFSFGTRAAEGDLTDAGSRLVIEIDGYHHFREPEAYRRDRRKDSLYQEHGWFVIRFLAEDVVREIEKVLLHIDYILARRESVRAHPSLP
jgi:very-short-patch-repair endonuclease